MSNIFLIFKDTKKVLIRVWSLMAIFGVVVLLLKNISYHRYFIKLYECCLFSYKITVKSRNK